LPSFAIMARSSLRISSSFGSSGSYTSPRSSCSTASRSRPSRRSVAAYSEYDHQYLWSAAMRPRHSTATSGKRAA
jgi:hypothetical protein